VKKDGQTLWVAIADPPNEAGVSVAETLTHCRIVTVLSTASALNEQIDRHYPRQAETA